MTNPVGRPTKYNDKTCEQVEKLAKLGLTDKEMADVLDISEQTFNTWKQEHPEFLESLKRGKEFADAQVVQSLYDRATGYVHDDVHVSNYQGDVTLTPIKKHYPPDTTACIFWLKNRQRGKWRDRTDHELTGKDGGPIKTKELNLVEAARRAVFLITAADKEIQEGKST